MKTILLVRHAKSGWTSLGETDFQRTLNDRGKHDAPMMAERLLLRGIQIDAFICSPALRAKETCEAFCKVFKTDPSSIIFVEKLYQAPKYVFTKVIDELTIDANCIAIFSHNPGITDFVNSLTKGAKIDNMPTCAVFAVEADIQHWQEFAEAEKKFVFVDYPKAAPLY